MIDTTSNPPLAPVRPVLDRLTAAGVEYWLDSGTLLGLYRDGHLLAGDADIDIGVCVKDEREAEALLTSLDLPGLSMGTRRFQGRLFKLKLRSRGARPIDVGIFRPAGDFLICPAVRGRGLREEWTNGEPRLPIAVAFMTRSAWAWVAHCDVARNPWRIGLRHEMWRIPASLVRSPVYHRGLDAPVPARIDKYLEFRYGDWRTPRTDWKYERDDGGYCLEPIDWSSLERPFH